jgi:biotin carboxyl carrier protein
MKLKGEIAGDEHNLVIQHRGSDLIAEIDDRKYTLQVRELAQGEYLIIDGSQVYDCHVTKSEKQGAFAVQLHGSTYELTIRDPKRLRSGQNSASHHHGMAEIIAPMPGKVVRVLVEVGNQVEAGAGIMVVEAMKMQNELKAPKAGTIVSLHAVAGATINAGAVLATVE